MTNTAKNTGIGAIKNLVKSHLKAQTSAHHWSQYKSCLLSDNLCLGDEKIIFRSKNIISICKKKNLVPQKWIIRRKQDLYWYQDSAEVWAIN